MLERESLDFVDIVTQSDTHFDLIRTAATARVAVVCQKPLAPSWRGTLEIAHFVAMTGVRAMVHENWRWQAWYREIARLISDGAIGHPLAYLFRMRAADGLGPEPYPSQPYFRTMPRFLVHEILVHHLDTARFLFGEIETVYAHLRRVNAAIAGEDRALLTVEHESGADGTIDGHRFFDPHQDSPVLGDAWLEGESGRIDLLGSGDVALNGAVVWNNRTSGYRGDSVYRTLLHFVDCLRGGKEFETSVENYLPTVAAVEAAYLSARERRPVHLREVRQTDRGG